MKLTKALICSILLLLSIQSFAQSTFYWVGNGGSWSDLSHWATTSGGSTLHTALPTIDDDVFFDQNSFDLPDQNVVMDLNSTCHNLDWSQATGNPRFNSSTRFSLEINGSLLISDSVRLGSFSGSYRFTADESTPLSFGKNRSFISSSSSRGRINIEGDGPFIFQDSIKSGHFIFHNGTTVDFNAQYLDVFRFEIRNNFSGSLDISGSEIHMDEFNNLASTATGYQLISDNSSELFIQKRFRNNDQDRSYGKITFEYNRAAFNSFEIPTITVNDTGIDSISIDSLKIDPLLMVSLPAGVTLDLKSLEATGSRNQPITIFSVTPGIPALISVTAGVVDAEFLDLTDIHAIGGAVFNANNSVDNGGNSGWIFSDPIPLAYYWVGNSGNWREVSHWATSSGGTQLHSNPPGRFDNVFFDANSLIITLSMNARTLISQG